MEMFLTPDNILLAGFFSSLFNAIKVVAAVVVGVAVAVGVGYLVGMVAGPVIGAIAGAVVGLAAGALVYGMLSGQEAPPPGVETQISKPIPPSPPMRIEIAFVPRTDPQYRETAKDYTCQIIYDGKKTEISARTPTEFYEKVEQSLRNIYSNGGERENYHITVYKNPFPGDGVLDKISSISSKIFTPSKKPYAFDTIAQSPDEKEVSQ